MISLFSRQWIKDLQQVLRTLIPTSSVADQEQPGLLGRQLVQLRRGVGLPANVRIERHDLQFLIRSLTQFPVCLVTTFILLRNRNGRTCFGALHRFTAWTGSHIERPAAFTAAFPCYPEIVSYCPASTRLQSRHPFCPCRELNYAPPFLTFGG